MSTKHDSWGKRNFLQWKVRLYSKMQYYRNEWLQDKDTQNHHVYSDKFYTSLNQWTIETFLVWELISYWHWLYIIWGVILAQEPMGNTTNNFTVHQWHALRVALFTLMFAEIVNHDLQEEPCDEEVLNAELIYLYI